MIFFYNLPYLLCGQTKFTYIFLLNLYFFIFIYYCYCIIFTFYLCLFMDNLKNVYTMIKSAKNYLFLLLLFYKYFVLFFIFHISLFIYYFIC